MQMCDRLFYSCRCKLNGPAETILSCVSMNALSRNVTRFLGTICSRGLIGKSESSSLGIGRVEPYFS